VINQVMLLTPIQGKSIDMMCQFLGSLHLSRRGNIRLQPSKSFLKKSWLGVRGLGEPPVKVLFSG